MCMPNDGIKAKVEDLEHGKFTTSMAVYGDLGQIRLPRPSPGYKVEPSQE